MSATCNWTTLFLGLLNPVAFPTKKHKQDLHVVLALYGTENKASIWVCSQDSSPLHWTNWQWNVNTAPIGVCFPRNIGLVFAHTQNLTVSQVLRNWTECLKIKQQDGQVFGVPLWPPRLPGEPLGQRSLAGYSPGAAESDPTEWPAL